MDAADALIFSLVALDALALLVWLRRRNKRLLLEDRRIRSLRLWWLRQAA